MFLTLTNSIDLYARNKNKLFEFVNYILDTIIDSRELHVPYT